MKREIPFKTEAELCAAFIAYAKEKWGLTAYAETAGWDILMVAPDGTQIGVQAKMIFNMKVLNQVVENGFSIWQEEGPDYRVVLLPYLEHSDILDALGIGLAYPNHWKQFEPDIGGREYWRRWHYWNPTKRHPLPEYVPDVAAGVSGPVQLTKWKIAALKIIAVLEKRGYVTRADFKRYSVDYRRWISTADWLIPSTVPGQFTRGLSLEFDKQHPVVYAQVKADLDAEIAAGFVLTP